MERVSSFLSIVLISQTDKNCSMRLRSFKYINTPVALL